MKVAIIKYNAGNFRPVIFALDRIGIEPVLTDDPRIIQKADRVIFSGTGEAGKAMILLKETGLDKVIQQLKQPVLGINLGTQLMCKYSEESNTDCLGIFDLNVKQFRDATLQQKIPQTGWNEIFNLKTRLFERLKENAFMYFIQSYYIESGKETISETNYILTYSSALRKDNFFAVQFLPEKSGADGLRVLENFLKI